MLYPTSSAQVTENLSLEGNGFVLGASGALPGTSFISNPCCDVLSGPQDTPDGTAAAQSSAERAAVTADTIASALEAFKAIAGEPNAEVLNTLLSRALLHQLHPQLLQQKEGERLKA
jgi:hypothetical protein